MFSGTAEKNDHVGTSLATVGSNPEDEEDAYNSLLVGIPGEDIGSTVDVGREIIWQPLRKHTAVYGPINGDVKDQHYGQVLSQDGPAYSNIEEP